jgi:hypothetical protein
VAKRREDQDRLRKDPRTGIWLWRRTHPKQKGRRMVRSTMTRRRTTAQAVAAQLDREWEKLLLGQPSKLDGSAPENAWGRRLAPLVDEWIEHKRLKRQAGEAHLARLKRYVSRSLTALRLRTVADLKDVALIDRRLEQREESSVTKRQQWQAPLKQFSKWLAHNNHVIGQDLLANWTPIARDEEEDPRAEPRAATELEMAFALAAVDFASGFRLGKSPLRLAFTCLLVLAPRISAFCSRDVSDLNPASMSVNMGKGKKKKLRGAGALDPQTCRELEAYVAGHSGALFRGPMGGRLRRDKALEIWQRAFGLGLVWRLWPDLPVDLPLSTLVERYLRTGRAAVSKGGNPKRISEGKRMERAMLADRVAGLGDSIAEEWRDLMAGVTLHAFRDTHETWARAKGVNPLFVDKQVGHAPNGGSATGRRHYLDMGAQMVNARLSAAAVRATLDGELGGTRNGIPSW